MDFSSLDALIATIQNDIAQSEAWLETPAAKAFAADALFDEAADK